MSKLDIHRVPERFSHIERAALYEEFCDREHGFTPSAQTDYKTIFKVGEFSGISEPAFIEGFMAALAFCSGAVSSGKVRDMTKWTKGIDVFQMTNYAAGCMNRQTLWEQNPQKEGEVAVTDV